MNDAAFDEFSKKLARGDIADMDPLLIGELPIPDANLYWHSYEAQAALRALKIQPRPESAPPVPHHSLKIKKGVHFVDPAVTDDDKDEE